VLTILFGFLQLFFVRGSQFVIVPRRATPTQLGIADSIPRDLDISRQLSRAGRSESRRKQALDEASRALWDVFRPNSHKIVILSACDFFAFRVFCGFFSLLTHTNTCSRK
jgi:hypothetical protein